MSSLDDLRSKHLKDYNTAILKCPPVSKQLLDYLEKMFSKKAIKPTSPTMEQELVYQAGIDQIINHLRNQNARQEDEIMKKRIKD